MKRTVGGADLPGDDEDGGASKRSRMTLEESRVLVSQTNEEEGTQTAIERMELMHRFFSMACKRHVHANEVCDDLTVPPAIYITSDTLGAACSDWVDRTIAASGEEGKEVTALGFHKALGIQQYQCFSDAIASAALIKTVPDPQCQLKCLYCDVRAHDSLLQPNTPILYTIATERKARCCHPRTVEQKSVWAIDPSTNRHPFESSPIYGPNGRTITGREGTAICHLCLWTRQIAQDSDLMGALMTWYEFTRLVHQDWLKPMDAHTRRICSCYYCAPGEEGMPPRGTICLFRLCRVIVSTDPNGLTGHDANQIYCKWDACLAKRAEEKAQERGYYTIDDPELTPISEALSTNYFQRILNASPPPPPPAPTTTAVTAAAQINFDDPGACLALMQQSKPAVDAFFKAMQTVTNFYGPSIHIARPLKTFGRLDCRGCGHSGHSGLKKCPFVMGTTIQERQVKGSGQARAKASLAEHILQNVETFGSEQRDSLLAIQKEYLWEIDEVMKRVSELVERRQAGVTTTVIPGPDPKFIGHNPSADQRRRSEAPRCTPLVPLKTLAACTLDMIMLGVNMDLFLDLQFLVNLVARMHMQDLDTTDVRHLIDWNQGLDLALRHDRAHAAISLHAFAKRISSLHPPAIPKYTVEAIVPAIAPPSPATLLPPPLPLTALMAEESSMTSKKKKKTTAPKKKNSPKPQEKAEEEENFGFLGELSPLNLSI